MCIKYTHARGVCGCAPPPPPPKKNNFFLKLGALSSRLLLRPYFYSNQDSSYLELVLRFFVTLHLFPLYAVRFKRGQKGHDTRQCEGGGGGTKGQILTKGGTCPWCPPGSDTYGFAQLKKDFRFTVHAVAIAPHCHFHMGSTCSLNHVLYKSCTMNHKVLGIQYNTA